MSDDRLGPDDFEVVESNQAQKINFSVIRLFEGSGKQLHQCATGNIIYCASHEKFQQKSM